MLSFHFTHFFPLREQNKSFLVYTIKIVCLGSTCVEFSFHSFFSTAGVRDCSKEDTESDKINELYEFSNDSSRD